MKTLTINYQFAIAGRHLADILKNPQAFNDRDIKVALKEWDAVYKKTDVHWMDTFVEADKGEQKTMLDGL